jgi:hypothetical protein
LGNGLFGIPAVVDLSGEAGLGRGRDE